MDDDVQELGKNGKRRKAAELSDEPEMFGKKHWNRILSYRVFMLLLLSQWRRRHSFLGLSVIIY